MFKAQTRLFSLRAQLVVALLAAILMWSAAPPVAARQQTPQPAPSQPTSQTPTAPTTTTTTTTTTPATTTTSTTVQPLPAQQQQPPAQQTGADQATGDEEAGGTDSVIEPKITDHRGVRIGMSADEARGKLGRPATKSETQDFYLIGDDEAVQVFYDAEGKVNAVAVTYTGKLASGVTSEQVLGEAVAAGVDGRTYKLVRYPSKGYWLAYSRTAGDAPIVTVTMRKMRAPRRVGTGG